MTQLGQQHAKVQSCGSGEAKRHVLSFNGGFSNSGLEAAAIRDGAAAHAESVSTDGFAIAVRRSEVAVSESRQCQRPGDCCEGNAHVDSAF